MGTITIRIPENVELEYIIGSTEETEKLLAKLKEIEAKSRRPVSDSLTGLFSEDAELMDQIAESAMKGRERDPLRAF